MADGARDRMIDSAVKLLATQGYQGTSFSAVLADAQAPRGSIYHHFPEGKDQLVLAALDRAGERARAVIDTFRGVAPEEVVGRFVGLWRSLLVATDYRVGCSLAGVTVTADAARVVERAAAAFRSWEAQLGEVLVAAGLGAEPAAALATLMVASCEGAVVLCRAQRSLAPLDTVEAVLRQVARG